VILLVVKKKTKKRKKDPNAPKRALSAYMYFANECREDVRAANPGIKFGDLGKRLGQMWKELSEDERKPYEEKAAADKQRYESERETYKQLKNGGGDPNLVEAESEQDLEAWQSQQMNSMFSF